MARRNDITTEAGPTLTPWLPEWALVLRQAWPRTEWLRSRDEFRLAMREISRDLIRNPPSDDELLDVVRWMRGPDAKQKFSPTTRELVIAVRVTRKASRGESGMAPGASIVADCKAAMLAAGDHERRWDIMCDPKREIHAETDTKPEDCEELQEWARSRWPDFEAAIDAMKVRMADQWRATRIRLFGLDSRIKHVARENQQEQAAYRPR